jgi:hypothetical protein
MKKLENDCVDCGKPCFSSCPYKAVPHYYCDNCGDEVESDELFKWNNGEDWCKECIINDVEEDLEKAYPLD